MATLNVLNVSIDRLRDNFQKLRFARRTFTNDNEKFFDNLKVNKIS